jgi:phosphoribosylamine--glycine ligase
MRILVLGAGGREHALAWKLSKSPDLSGLFIAPGNAGTANFGTNLEVDLKNNSAIINLCIENQINIVVVGPEEPLVNGIYDAIKENTQTSNIQVIGPSKFAAQLEGSKLFAKNFMERHGIPTAAYQSFNKDNFEEGVEYIKKQTLPVVLKADGLAGGKGVLICEKHIEAIAEFEMMLKFSKFGDAGNKVVVEEFLNGTEFSVFAITDGETYKILPVAKDYKRAGEGDAGLNTGGMGAISPVPFVNELLYKKVIDRIVEPTIRAFKSEGLVYKGFVFFGLISVQDEPYVIEYNCRLGDPETEVVIPRLTNDLLEIFIKLFAGELSDVEITEAQQQAVTIVATSGGYPNYFNSGYKITGLEQTFPDSMVFISGAKKENDQVITTGGRVLAVTSMANSLDEAVAKCRHILTEIKFEDMYFRKDIGYEFLN